MGAAAIARQLGGTRQGHNWRCLCPLDCGYALSLSDGEDGRLLGLLFWRLRIRSSSCRRSSSTDCSTSDDGDISCTLSPRLSRPSAHDAERIAHAREIYASGVQDERIQIYLRSRGIKLTSPVLRFSEHAPHRLGARLPAMLAPVVNVIRRADRRAHDLSAPRRRRQSRSPKRISARMPRRDPWRGDPPRGPRSGYGAHCRRRDREHALRDADFWSARLVGGFRRRAQDLELPPDVRRIIIAADNDASGAGQRNALAAYDRWTAEGRSVRIKTPPDVGDDFNDVLIKRRPDARH